MSYILKALRKSEAERTKGTVPRLTTQHDPEPPSRKSLWPVLIAGALLVNGALVAVVLWQADLLPGPGQSAELASAEPAQVAPGPAVQSAAPTPVAPAPVLTQVASLDDTEVGASPDVPAPREPAEAPMAVEPPVLEPAAAPVRDLAPVAEAAIPPVAIEAAVPEVAPLVVETVVVEPVASGPAPRPKAKPAFDARFAERTFGETLGRDRLAWAVAEPERPVEPPPPEPVDPFAEVPELWRMTQSFRQNVPAITISVHVYSPEDRKRFIIIDRHKYWEGDVLDGGVLLQAILPQGVVFELDGQQFKLISG